MTDRLPLPQPLPRQDGWTIPGVYTADQMRQYADDANAALRAEIYAQQKVIAAYEQCNPPWVQELRERVKALEDALWTMAEHNELYFGKNHSTVIQARAALEASK